MLEDLRWSAKFKFQTLRFRYHFVVGDTYNAVAKILLWLTRCLHVITSKLLEMPGEENKRLDEITAELKEYNEQGGW